MPALPPSSPRRFATALVALAFLFLAGSSTPTLARDTTTPRAAAAITPPPPTESHSATAGSHSDPISPVLLGILIILIAARLGGHAFELLGQPAVLGELVVGVLLGNLHLLGFPGLDFLKIDYDQSGPLYLSDHLRFAGISIDHLARIGVILLLFQVGLETNIADFRRVGLSAFVVACLGVVAPMFLGYGAGLILVPDRGWTVHLFLGATLAATSVGITARVFRDLRKTATKEAQIVLGAAVIDDVLGLLVLAVVQGVIVAQGAAVAGAASTGLDLAGLGLTVGKAVVFLFGALLLGQFVSRSLFRAANRLHGSGLLLITALAFCFGLAWLASEVGLAPIVGAFAAGLILEKVQYRELAHREGERELEDLVKPLADLLVPIFFVMMGFQVDLRSFADPSVLKLSALLIVAAVIGKQICGLGVLERGLDRRSIGIGMIPRGEVGLIFAAIGRQLRVGGERVVDDGVYSALIVMVIFTTLVTPPLLKWSLDRADRRRATSPTGDLSA